MSTTDTRTETTGAELRPIRTIADVRAADKAAGRYFFQRSPLHPSTVAGGPYRIDEQRGTFVTEESHTPAHYGERREETYWSVWEYYRGAFRGEAWTIRHLRREESLTAAREAAQRVRDLGKLGAEELAEYVETAERRVVEYTHTAAAEREAGNVASAQSWTRSAGISAAAALAGLAALDTAARIAGDAEASHAHRRAAERMRELHEMLTAPELAPDRP